MSPRRPAATLLKGATIFYAVLALLAWGWAGVFDIALLGETSPSVPAVFHGFILGIGVVVLSGALYAGSRSVRRSSEILEQFLRGTTVLGAVWLALISGFAEEVMFRGALFGQLGLIGTSIFFGLCHFVPLRAFWWYPIYAAFAGYLFGVLRGSSGSVWPCVVAHVVINGINLSWLAWRVRKHGRRVRRTTTTGTDGDVSHGEDPDAFALPEEIDVPDTFPFTVWRYDLRVEPSGTDRQNLPLCLEGENLALFSYVDREEVYDALRGGRFIFAESFRAPLRPFPHDVAAFSAYVFDIVTGIEVAERYVDETRTDDVRAWKVVARRGEWVKVPLEVQQPEPGRFEVDPDEEDQGVLRAQWTTYPRWFQDGMRFKYPQLRDL